MGGDAADPYPPPPDFEEEDDVEPLQQHGLDCEEVGGQDVGGLCPDELRPNRPTPARCRTKTAVLQDPGDRARSEMCAELDELTFDATVAPPRVLGRQSHHQSSRLLIDGGTTWTPVCIGPASGHETTVPGQQGGRCDREGCPAGPGEKAAERGEQRPVSRLELDTGDSTSEDRHLVAQSEQLDLVGLFRACHHDDQLEETTDCEIGERPEVAS